jgi:hypothetical protein
MTSVVNTEIGFPTLGPCLIFFLARLNATTQILIVKLEECANVVIKNCLQRQMLDLPELYYSLSQF